MNKINKIYLITNNDEYKNHPLFAYLKENLKILKSPKQADAIFVLGGDGTMLKAIRAYKDLKKPFYGFNFGHIGFLMNKPEIETAKKIILGETKIISAEMLKADLYNYANKKVKTEFAFNDFYFERRGARIAKIKVTVDGQIIFNPLACDGIIVSTSAGSTAYTASAGGIILPIGTNSFVITAISPAVFHYWRSAQLSHNSEIILENLNSNNYKTCFVADGIEMPEIQKAIIKYSGKSVKLGFIKSQNFQSKVLKLQFGQK